MHTPKIYVPFTFTGIVLDRQSSGFYYVSDTAASLANTYRGFFETTKHQHIIEISI